MGSGQGQEHPVLIVIITRFRVVGIAIGSSKGIIAKKTIADSQSGIVCLLGIIQAVGVIDRGYSTGLLVIAPLIAYGKTCL